MIYISDLIIDDDFASTYTVVRDAGEWVNGRWTPSTTNITNYGAVLPYTPQQAEYTENGDFITGEMAFYSKNILYTTRESGTSDTLIYNSISYKISDVKDYSKYGYYKAIAMRVSTL